MKKTVEVVPAGVLDQHIAVLGKTGSGKTSTAKLLVEQVVAEGARVCILDPIKSDWWGLTSSADGQKAGLPFHILGGPRGHVPLHAGAGKAIAEIVANASLPLSIIDMADFEPGGQAKFFTEFAPALLRKMRGVVYLVMEEAHLFAPKERSGMGEESLSIHWAKMIATAGRSKGVRLILVTQRTQALHNALLGSCDTMIAHRLTAPADQKPVVDWLKANTSKEILEQVSSSLASLKTGSAWLCSGEAKRFEVMHFPRIHTFDNSATPTGDGDTRVIKTAAVDQEKLRAIIGDAVDQAKAEDPKELKKQLAEAQKMLLNQSNTIGKLQAAEKPANKSSGNLPKTIEKPVLKDGQLARAEALVTRLEKLDEQLRGRGTELAAQLESFSLQVRDQAAAIAGAIRSTRQPSVAALLPGRPVSGHNQDTGAARASSSSSEPIGRQQVTAAAGARTSLPSSTRQVGPGQASGGRGVGQRILDALAELEQIGAKAPARELVAFMAGYSNLGSKGFRNGIGALRGEGLIDYPSDGAVTLTETGRNEARWADAPKTPRDVQTRVIAMLGGASGRILEPLIAAYPEAMTREDVASRAGYENLGSKGFRNAIGRLRSLGFVDYPHTGTMVANPVLFLEAR